MKLNRSWLPSKFLVIVPVVLVLLITAACGDDATNTPAATAIAAATNTPAPTATAIIAPTPTPDTRRGGTLRVMDGWAAEPSHFDIHQSQSAQNLWATGPLADTVLRKDPTDGNRTLVADLAEEWSLSDDNLTATFKFRDGVKFHDGSDFTAADAVATLQKIVFPGEDIVSPKAVFTDGNIDEIVAVDRLTMEIRLSQPFTFLMELLANPFLAIVSKAQLDAVDGSLRDTYPFVATGPFILAEHRLGEVSIFERFPDYWNAPRPFLDRLEMHWIAKAAALAAFQAGQADWMHSPSTNDIPKLLEDPANKLLEGPAFVFSALFYNTQKPPFSDVRMRRALDMVIERQSTVDAGNPIMKARLGSFIAAGSEYDDTPEALRARPGFSGITQAAIDEARALVVEAGYGDGVEVDYLIRGTTFVDAETNAPLVFEAGKKIGITVNLKPTGFGVFYDEALNRDYDLAGATLGLQTADPFENLASYYLDPSAPVNLANYDNPAARILIKLVGSTPNGPGRLALVDDVKEFLHEDVPASFLLWGDFPAVLKTYVMGFPDSDLGLYGRYRFDHIWLDK